MSSKDYSFSKLDLQRIAQWGESQEFDLFKRFLEMEVVEEALKTFDNLNKVVSSGGLVDHAVLECVERSGRLQGLRKALEAPQRARRKFDEIVKRQSGNVE